MIRNRDDQKSIQANRDAFISDFGPLVSEYSMPPQDTCMSEHMPHLSEDEWRCIIRKLFMKKAQYQKYLSSKILSIFIENDPNIRDIFESIFWSANFPPEYIRSKIVLIPKSDGVKVRPIAIAHPFLRVIDLICLILLNRTPEITSFPHQYGFSRNRGIRDIFIHLRHIFNQLKRKTSYFIILISIDIKDTFESFDIQTSLEGLREKGVPQCILSFMQYLLQNRRSAIANNENEYRFKQHSKGSFQGGFCSPILFNSATRNVYVTQCGRTKFHTFKFADDVLIVSQLFKSPFARSAEDSVAAGKLNQFTDHIISMVLDRIRKLLVPSGLSINIEKSKSIIVTHNESINFYLQRRESIKFIGLCINQGPTTNLIGNLTSRLHSVYIMLRKRSNSLSACPVKAFPYIYNVSTNSLLRFFGPLVCSNTMPSVDTLCRKIAATITSVATSSSHASLFQMLSSIDPVEVIDQAYNNACWNLRVPYLDHNNSFINEIFEMIDRSRVLSRKDIQQPGCYIVEINEQFLSQMINPSSIKIMERKMGSRYWIQIEDDKSKSICLDLTGSNELLIYDVAISYLLLVSRLLSSTVIRFRTNQMNAILNKKANLISYILARLNGILFIIDEPKFEMEEVSGCPALIELGESLPFKTKLLHPDLLDELKVWRFSDSMIREIEIIRGCWHRWTNKCTCICGKKLTTHHIIWQCQRNRSFAPDIIREYQDGGTSLSLLKSITNFIDLKNVSAFIIRSLRMNNIVCKKKQ